jgi:hypothetical protein
MATKTRALFALVAGSALFLTSCIGVRTTKTARPVSFLPDYVEMQVKLDDYQYLGTEEVTVKFRRYFGFYTITDSINGQLPTIRNFNIVNMGVANNIAINARLRTALYAAMYKHPDADFIVPVNIRSQVDQMFLGRVSRETLRVKLYKIKENK